MKKTLAVTLHAMGLSPSARIQEFFQGGRTEQVDLDKLEKLPHGQPGAAEEFLVLRSGQTVRVVQIWISTAFSELSTRLLIRRSCLISLKKSSICQRSR